LEESPLAIKVHQVLPKTAMAASVSVSAEQNSHREKRRKCIVAAASKLFAKLGYAECDMESLAKKLKIAKGTLYLYFPSKEDLFFACVDQGMQDMQATVLAAAEKVDQSDPIVRISAAVQAYLEFFIENPEQVELIIQERASFKNRKRPTYFDYRDSSRARWREIYHKLIADGRLRDDLPVERMLDTFGNLVYGTMFTNHFLGTPVPLEEQHAAIMKIVFEGLWSDEERKKRSST
jgi:AcrR family transcriptional regulator